MYSILHFLPKKIVIPFSAIRNCLKKIYATKHYTEVHNVESRSSLFLGLVLWNKYGYYWCFFFGYYWVSECLHSYLHGYQDIILLVVLKSTSRCTVPVQAWTEGLLLQWFVCPGKFASRSFSPHLKHVFDVPFEWVASTWLITLPVSTI